ncbi:MAG: hypothetical protein NZ703_15520, partial [Gemmataceae bacterium]|nr:hypothetical protein [Gemmataceae bacterium]
MTNDKVATYAYHLPMFVLDVLRHDAIEQLSSIVKMLNNVGCIGWRDCWPHDFTVEEIVPVLEQLVRDGLVDVLRESEAGNEVVPVSIETVDLKRDMDIL